MTESMPPISSIRSPTFLGDSLDIVGGKDSLPDINADLRHVFPQWVRRKNLRDA